jgi:glycosyltransferase involved in cell wall biosynthesis
MISIITPVYNNVRFIEQCIINVIEQNFLDLEHIIIDGGSTDGTVDIIRKYAERYPHILWVSERDKGQSDALNKGINMAKGRIIGILNVDDFYEPNVLNRVSTLFETLTEPTLLVGNCNVLTENNQLLHITHVEKLDLYILLNFWRDTGIQWPVNPSAYFYHKSLHQKIGLFKVEEQFAMDLDFLIRAVQSANIVCVNEVWGNFRYIEGTKTFREIQAGRHLMCRRRLYRQYRKNLPLLERVELANDYFIVTKWPKIRYFLTHPREYIQMIKSHLLKGKQ